ncbi:hypothetical protein [Amycolatopsis rhizosphaerae]|uniref:hypothetical protein n=1 Tax=Amycolatopsis rhizosphaerae TaxID=2053003 RepID=UPI001C964FB9|nr:hypothetical protein [Amycolatopsis rhizosphaerae]
MDVATDWTITDVVELRRWAGECALPGGKLSGATEFEPLPGGREWCACWWNGVCWSACRMRPTPARSGCR